MADKVLPQRVSMLGGGDLGGPPSGCWLWAESVSQNPAAVGGRSQSCRGNKLTNPFPFLQIRELVPESQAYMDLLAFERKLDQTIARKRMEIQEAIKKPLTVCAVLATPGPSQASLPLLGLVFWGPGPCLRWARAGVFTAGCSP